MANTQYSRIRHHGLSTTGDVPTVAPSGDITDGTWVADNIYQREIAFNVTDDRAFWRSDNGIVEFAMASGANAAWSTVGNAGTVDGTNFIGTTDNVPFTIRVNDLVACRLDPTNNNVWLTDGLATTYPANVGNTIIGAGAGVSSVGEECVVIGHNAGAIDNGVSIGSGTLAWNIVGNITAVGFEAISGGGASVINTGTGLSAFGYRALYTNRNGDNNTAIGYSSLFACYDGNNNTALGLQAGSTIVNGNSNTIIGSGADTKSAGTNVSVAIGALAESETDSVAIGAGAKAETRTISIGTSAGTGFIGDRNIAIGYNSANTISNCEQSVIIGYNSGNTLSGGGTIAQNTFVGYQADAQVAGATAATAIGANTTADSDGLAIGASSDAGTYGVAVGRSAQAITECIAIGYGAMTANTVTGTIGIGKNVLAAANTGANNTGIGHTALTANTSGNDVTAVGQGALNANTTGDFNTAVGSAALVTNTTGESNTAIGHNALKFVTTGDNNTALGDNAGDTITTGDNNTLLGFATDVTGSGVTNATALGYNTQAGTNQMVFGNSSVVQYTFSNMQNFANNAAAITGGLAVGDLYYTASGGDGLLKIVI